MAHTVNPLTRRAFLHGGARLAVVVAGLRGVARVPDVHADNKKKPKIKSVAERTDEQRSTCEGLGGKLAVLDGPDGGNTTECKGGSRNGRTCINTKKASTCSFALTTVPTKPGGSGAAPPSGGTEDPTDPSSPLTDPAAPPAGGHEHPSGGDEPPSGGGGQAGGGGAVGPGGATEQPSDPGSGGGGGVILYAGHGGTRLTANRRGAHRRRRHGKGWRR